MIDPIFADPRLAAVYDTFDGERADLSVRWLHGDVGSLPPLQVDLVTMTGNVAQVFLGDEEWAGVLATVRDALRPGGRLVFESRRPEREAWRGWTREASWTRAVVSGSGAVETWVDVLDVQGDRISFRWTFRFADDGAGARRP